MKLQKCKNDENSEYIKAVDNMNLPMQIIGDCSSFYVLLFNIYLLVYSIVLNLSILIDINRENIFILAITGIM